jgi:protein-tyrosine phosphatase
MLNASRVWVEKAREEKVGVLVHCMAGKSRSPSVVIMYLMQHHGYTLQTAFDYVTSKRNGISPNIGFFLQLLQHEKAIHGHTSMNPDEYAGYAGKSD